MPVNRAGLLCSCGAVGCWETEVGALSLIRRAGRASQEGRDAIDAILDDVGAGVPRAVAAIGGTGHWLGFGLAGLANLFNPRLIAPGGLFGRIPPFVAAI